MEFRLPYPVLFATTHDGDTTAAPPWTLLQQLLDDSLGPCTAAESARVRRDAARWLS
jgi:hypothetical protein